MDMLNRFSQRATLCGCALLLCFSLAAGADEIQEINKLFKQGKQEQALGRVNAYLATKPKDAQARFLKGLILTEQDKTDEAIRVFSDLTEDFRNCLNLTTTSPCCMPAKASMTRPELRWKWPSAPIPAMPPRMRIWATSTPRWQARLMTAHCNWITATPARKPSWR